jgi:hypothetical protein
MARDALRPISASSRTWAGVTKVHGHADARRTVDVLAKPFARRESRSHIQRPSGSEGIHGPSFQQKGRVSPCASLRNQSFNESFTNTQSP